MSTSVKVDDDESIIIDIVNGFNLNEDVSTKDIELSLFKDDMDEILRINEKPEPSNNMIEFNYEGELFDCSNSENSVARDYEINFNEIKKEFDEFKTSVVLINDEIIQSRAINTNLNNKLLEEIKIIKIQQMKLMEYLKQIDTKLIRMGNSGERRVNFMPPTNKDPLYWD
jgi:hypothetical protein